MKLVVAGQGAFGIKHIEALKNIPDVEVVSLAGGSADSTREVAKKYGIPHWSTDLGECLAQPGVEAAILATPTQMHAKQAHPVHARRQARADRDSDRRHRWRDAETIVQACRRRPASSRWRGHTRRFNPSHQWIHKRIKAGELKVQQMDVQTYFFRRTNMNALGKPRSWTDHLLWHHACHTVDLFQLPDRRDGVEAPRAARARCIPSSRSRWT